MRIAYARTSTARQNLDRQLDALKAAGCERIFEEKVSGKQKSRPELDRMLDMLRPGDQVVVVKLDRIGRNTKHLIELAETFSEKGVDFISLGDAIDTSTATGKLFFTIASAFAEFEGTIISERTRDGLAAARARGRNGGRPKADKRLVEQAIKMYDARTFSLKEIESATGLSKRTLYRYLNERKAKMAETTTPI